MQTIKSLTPATTVVLQWLVWMKHFDWRIGATLIPIVGGILLTSVTEMSFNMLRFCAALLAVWLHLQRLSLQNLFSMDTNLTVKMTPYEEENAKRMEALNIRHLSQSLQKSSSSKAKYKWFEKDEASIKKSFNSRGTLTLKNALFKVRNC
ncbi:uncharacterized protein LOC123881740 isoform X3 [Trifolium pratense]|uniref:uncharacterized protein LOC123881740 isoform X3 n=1 Tax=Trifolium pratense TaxID=57577 RepID=UPI001E690EAA|nr:uncharacterized protein LOC123881740 isoform X3 [Trifolium pratense]